MFLLNILYKNAIIFLVIIMNIDLRNWMKNIDDDVNLFSINFAGTHDCATRFVQLSHFARCQDLSIYDQLCLGVRALDVRVQARGEQLGIVHGIAKCFNTNKLTAKQMDIEDIIEQCRAFLEENPDETVVMMFKNDNGKEMEKCFDNLFYNYIKGNENLWYLQNRIPKLGEVRGKIVLIRRCNKNLNNKDMTPLNTGIDFSAWIEQDTAVPEALLLNTNSADNAKFIIQDRYKYKPKPRWEECVKPFLDERKEFDGKYVVCYLSTAGGLSGPYRNAQYINSHFMSYPLANDTYYGIIFADFPTSDMCNKIIKTNESLFR